MDRKGTLAVQFSEAVDRVSCYVHHAAPDLGARRHGNRRAGRIDRHTPLETVRGIHRDGSHRLFSDVLFHFQSQGLSAGALHLESLADARQIFRAFGEVEMHVDHRPDNLGNMSFYS